MGGRAFQHDVAGMGIIKDAGKGYRPIFMTCLNDSQQVSFVHKISNVSDGTLALALSDLNKALSTCSCGRISFQRVLI